MRNNGSAPDEALQDGLNLGCRHPEDLARLVPGLQDCLGDVITVWDALLAAVGGRHTIPGAVKNQPCQQEVRWLGVCLPKDGIGGQRRLNGIECGPVDDGLVVPSMGNPLMDDLPHVAAVPQEIGQRTFSVRHPSPPFAA